jgi:hypothetical protein
VDGGAWMPAHPVSANGAMDVNKKAMRDFMVSFSKIKGAAFAVTSAAPLLVVGISQFSQR